MLPSPSSSLKHIRRLLSALLCCALIGQAQERAGASRPSGLGVDNSAAFTMYEELYKIPTRVSGHKQMNQSGPVVVSHALPKHSSGSVPGRASTYPSQHLIDLAERSSLIAIVQLKDSKTLMTDDQSFLYSNFSVSVDQVLLDRDNQTFPGAQIIITRAGGTLTFDGVVVEAVDTEFRPFEAGGRYLLFLNVVPGTASFKATAPGSFQMDAKAEAVHPLDLHTSEATKTPDSFVAEVLGAVSAAAIEERAAPPVARQQI